MKRDRRDGSGDGELDRILLETEIQPSSGFTASVMAAVRNEAVAPPPIPFPWKRALPGLLVAASMLIAVVVVTVIQLASGVTSGPVPETWTAAFRSLESFTVRFSVGWIALALLSSFACMKLAAWFAPRRA